MPITMRTTSKKKNFKMFCELKSREKNSQSDVKKSPPSVESSGGPRVALQTQSWTRSRKEIFLLFCVLSAHSKLTWLCICSNYQVGKEFFYFIKFNRKKSSIWGCIKMPSLHLRGVRHRLCVLHNETVRPYFPVHITEANNVEKKVNR